MTDTTDDRRRTNERIHAAPDNGYRLSVIHDGYGASSGLAESAIVHDGEICYGPAAADIIGPDGVRGWMTTDDVDTMRDRVRRLPRLDGCGHGR